MLPLALALLSAAPGAGATNFLVLVADDLGADRMDTFSDYSTGAYGGQFVPATPVLDDLAAAGLTFSNAWANPVCSPSRASLLTGNFPFHTNVGDAANTPNDPALASSDTTLPEALAPYGYESGLFGKWHLGFVGSGGSVAGRAGSTCARGLTTEAQDPSPIVHGFDVYAGSMGGEPSAYTAWALTTGSGDGTTSTCIDDADFPDEYYASAALDWINTRTGPFFAMVAFNAPHADEDGVQYEREWEDLSTTCQSTVEAADSCIRKGSCGDSDGDGVDDSQDLLYLYQVQCLDTTIGGLLDGIDPTLLADTVILFLGDNGTPGNNTEVANFLEDPYTRSVSAITGDPRYGKGTTYLSGVRVPFIVTDGRNRVEQAEGAALTEGLVQGAGRTVARSLVIEDVMPTFLALAGAASVTTDGADFSECLTNRSPGCAAATLGARPQYAEVFDHRDDGSLDTARTVLRLDGHRLVTDYTSRDDCLMPSIYAVPDAFDETDLYATASPRVVRSLKIAMDAMAIPWLPRNALGNIRWCR